MHTPRLGCLLPGLAILLVTAASPAQLRLARIFGDHMVLQCDKPVRVWGWASPGEAVTLRFGQQVRETTSSETGAWSVTLGAMPANAVGAALVVEGTGDARVTAADVLVGEVWICGGQSNMEWAMRASTDADIEIPSANHEAIRFIRLPKIARPEPQTDFPKGDWRVCAPNTVEHCTAVGYYFARRLNIRLGVPVGLVDTSWGGTMAQHWVPRNVLEKIPEMQPYFDKHKERVAAWIAGGREEGKNPAHQGQPAGMYNGVIKPLAGLAIRGALFYQGENNSFTVGWKPFPKTYPAVIDAWREAFGQADLPFGLIQIAGWSNRRSMKYDMNHHTNIVREVQHRTWERTKGTGLIVTFDTNSNQSIHPGRKLPVGERTARWALAEVYGAKGWRDKPLEWRGPLYESMEIVGKRIVVNFDDATDRGLRLDKDAELGFYVAGKDRTFHVARARVRGKTRDVEVWSDAVPEPVAVRYGWSNLPLGSLMNARELPAYPFRSDTWPLVPHQSTGAYEVERN
ncbi:MAG: hypothetical protein HRU14_08295 [Planctomycetes bacterium]|nr:hypothetical protein [Planctomycetota bacterium]